MLACPSVPGPVALGRGVVVRRDDRVPEAWAGAEVIRVTPSVLATPGRVVTALHHAWVTRRPVAVVLEVDPARFRDPLSFDEEPWRLDARFEVWLDRLHFLVWANNYDAREGKPAKWWWSEKAERVGARKITDGQCGDVLLPDGTAAWIDGGPRGPFARAALGAAVVHAESVELGRLVAAPESTCVRSALAPDQLAAVSHGAGPARIIAPAGSGKTRVLTERLRHLMLDRGFEREHVVAVAYNKKAQLEMQQRTADFRPRVSTLNSLGYQLLKKHAGRAPRVLEEREVRRLIDSLLPRQSHRANVDRLAPYVEALSVVRLGLRSPHEVEAAGVDVPGLTEIFAPYRRALADQDAVDFDEQIYRAIVVLLRDGPFRRRMQGFCRHLLVDEFQDLTAAHVLLLRLLASPSLQVFGVGDDDQVIYGHAGADPAFLIDFERLFPGAASHPLKVNYRCPITVVSAACALLSHNQFRVPKAIEPGPAAVSDATALAVHQHDPESGAAAVVNIVQRWLQEGVPTSGIAVLTRVNSLLLAPFVALVEAGVPVVTPISLEMLERTGVRAALAYLRLGAAPDRLQQDDLWEVRNRPSRGLPPWITKWLQQEMSLDELYAVADRLHDFRVGDKLAELADDVQLVADAMRTKTTRQVLRVVADGVGLGRALTLLDHSHRGRSGSQVDDLEALIQVADLHPDPVTFESWLRGVLARGSHHQGVMLSTVHRVKGMEWDRVIVAGVTEGVFPHRLAEDREEERRVLHVAITRCRQQVVVLADASRPSPFLPELHEAATPPARRSSSGARRSMPPTPHAAPAAETAGVRESLRAWRRGRSLADKVPPFVVAADALLDAIAQSRPATLDELARIKGVGPKRLQLYGPEILAVVQATFEDPAT